MRLLNANNLSIVEFFGNDVPAYAILSHTWGDEEVTFQNMRNGKARRKSGYKKIQLLCKQTLADDLKWAWIDTACIDKTSSAELSEAINSMYEWYANAKVCYAYLSDATWEDDKVDHSNRKYLEAMRDCRWFTRGWTLQELLAPKIVTFFDKDWRKIGDTMASGNLNIALSMITGIDVGCIAKPESVSQQSVARRMSWAANRRCTRTEDVAYCLMGLFRVHMPLLYGEGSNAFTRLQEEIWHSTDDHSLLYWSVHPKDRRAWQIGSVFAESPRDFGGSSDVKTFGNEMVDPGVLTKQGLPLRIILTPVPTPGSFQLRSHEKRFFDASLNCGFVNSESRYQQIAYSRARIRLLPAVARMDPFGTSRTIHSSYVRVITPFLDYEAAENTPITDDGEKQTIYVRKLVTEQDRKQYGFGKLELSLGYNTSTYEGIEEADVYSTIEEVTLRNKKEENKTPWWIWSEMGKNISFLSKPYGDPDEFATLSFKTRERDWKENTREAEDFHILFGIRKGLIFCLLRPGRPCIDVDQTQRIIQTSIAATYPPDQDLGTSVTIKRTIFEDRDNESVQEKQTETRIIWAPTVLRLEGYQIGMRFIAGISAGDIPHPSLELHLTVERRARNRSTHTRRRKQNRVGVTRG